MYKYIAKDFQGNWFVSNEEFKTKIEAENHMYNLMEWNFIDYVELIYLEESSFDFIKPNLGEIN